MLGYASNGRKAVARRSKLQSGLAMEWRSFAIFFPMSMTARSTWRSLLAESDAALIFLSPSLPTGDRPPQVSLYPSRPPPQTDPATSATVVLPVLDAPLR